MKRVFEIEFPDDYGEMWMNQDNLMLCINAYCKNEDGEIKAIDVTDKVVYLSKDQSLPDNAFLNPSCPEEDGSEVAYEEAQQDMLKQGWRKVELEK